MIGGLSTQQASVGEGIGKGTGGEEKGRDVGGEGYGRGLFNFQSIIRDISGVNERKFS